MGYLNKLTAGANAAPNLQVDAARTAFLYFNLDEVPQGAVLRWAKLRLFLPSVRVRGSGLGVHVVTGRWDEALPSSSLPQFSLSPVGIIPPEKLGTRRFVTVDVTSTVQAWINGGTLNEGFAIKAVSGGSATSSLYLTSKDGASLGLPAELDLDFKADFSQLPDSIQQYFSPSFTTEPSVSVSNGIIGAETSGMGPMSYQWYRNGVAVIGGTSSTLPLLGLASGTYSLCASNRFAKVTSGPVEFVSPNTVSVGAFVSVSAGSYQRGNLNGDNDIYDAPVQTVSLSQYYMAVNDITKAQWDEVRTWATTRGYTDLAEGEGKAWNHPVVSVSWYDVVKWMNAASEKDGLTPCYRVDQSVYRSGNIDSVECDWTSNGYRLPTEAEWEVASRGGLTTKRFPWGDTISQSQANYAASTKDLYDLSSVVDNYHPTYATGDFPFTSPVGSFPANAYGLCDMTGNVSQWCWDWSGAHSGGVNPRGPSSGSFRALRGGSWWKNFNLGGEGGASATRIARRHDDYPEFGKQYNGFRVARGKQ